MTGRHNRAAIYLRVSRDDQTTENQRLVLARVAEHRGWIIVQTYEDQGISGAKGRDQLPRSTNAQGRGTATLRFLWSGRSIGLVAVFFISRTHWRNWILLGLRSIPTSRPSTARHRWAELFRWHPSSASKSGI